MAGKYTREKVIDEKRCGIEAFDAAVAKVGRVSLLKSGIEIYHKSPTTWGGSWAALDWAFGNAVVNVTGFKGSMTWNLDEVFTEVELATIAAACNIDVPYVQCWPRRATRKQNVVA